jgi:hypothetical protein
MLAAVPPSAHIDGRRRLGSGVTAVVYAQDPWAGSTIALRTLELRRGRLVLQRFRESSALPADLIWLEHSVCAQGT